MVSPTQQIDLKDWEDSDNHLCTFLSNVDIFYAQYIYDQVKFHVLNNFPINKDIVFI